MPKKRKNGGKCRHNRGSYKSVRCDISGALVPKDKAVIGYRRVNLVDPSGQKDLKDASYYDKYRVPKLYCKLHACISSAVHRKLVRSQPRDVRKQHKHTDFHIKVKRQRESENRVIQQKRREIVLKSIRRKRRMDKQFKKSKRDPRKVSRYLANNPQLMKLIMDTESTLQQ